MSIAAHGGFCITTKDGTYSHVQGISDESLRQIIYLLKQESTSRKPESEIPKIKSDDILSMFIFTPPGGIQDKK